MTRIPRHLWIAVAVGWIAVAQLAAQTPTPSRGPQNPAFIQFLNNPQLLTTSVSSDGHALGLIPSTIDFSYLRGSQMVLGAGSFPASYDLRTTGKMTAVRDQGQCGDCWAFATFGSIESVLKPAETRDFSENNLNNLHGYDFPRCQGGNPQMSMAYLARWAGPVDESADPYISTTSPAGLPAQKHVQDVILIAPRGSATNNDALKSALMTYGAVQTSMYMDAAYFNSGTAAYYYTGSAYANHSVTLAGWDDNYPRTNFTSQAPGNGAFLIKNSWGTYWGQAGYFWVSYYDARYALTDASFVYVYSQPTTNYSRVYQYDTLGWVSHYGYGLPTASFANVFTAVASEQLQAVSFYVESDSSPYTVKIYTNVGTTPTSGTLASTTSGTNATAGYHTVVLSLPVALAAGTKFSVVVTETTPGSNNPIPVETAWTGYSSAATASPGQSYVSPDGVSSWSDISADSRTNVCLKAFTGVSAVPDLTITKSHTGNFTQLQAGTYTIAVRNSGAASTSGTVNVTDTLPAGLTATSMMGSGWNCMQPAGPCARSDALGGGASYAAITLTVNVLANAPLSVTNTATVSGGGETNAGNDQASDLTTITSVTAVPDVISSPASGSLLSDPPFTICWTNNGNYTHWLDIGTAPGNGDLYGWTQPAGTNCKTITDPGMMLGNGGTVYVKVYSAINGSWQTVPGSSASYITPQHTFWPPDGTVFTSSSVTFSWAPVPGATQYWLDVGPWQGNGSIFGGTVTGTSKTVANIPPTSIRIWARLWAIVGGVTQLQGDHIYTACSQCVGTITTPAAEGSLSGPSASFCWNPPTGGDGYWLDVGTIAGTGNLYGGDQGTGTCRTVSGLPTTGIVYVQLFTHANGDWKKPAMGYRYLGVNSTSTVYSPAPGSTLGSSTVTFSWSGINGAQGYWLDVGTVRGSGNIYGGYQGTAASKTVTGLPTGAIWVRVWTYYAGMVVPMDFQYTR